MNQLYKLNEGEYKFILNETLHYPKFLDNIKNEIFNIVFQIPSFSVFLFHVTI